MFVIVTAVLASDVFLPVPSGPLSTLAGSQLGFLLGTAASTLGMTLGGMVAFGLARLWGWPLAERLASVEHLHSMSQACLAPRQVDGAVDETLADLGRGVCSLSGHLANALE